MGQLKSILIIILFLSSFLAGCTSNDNDTVQLEIISLNENDSLLMIPGVGMRVDTKKHRLGMKVLEHEP